MNDVERQADEKRQAELKSRGNLPRHVAVIMDGNGRWAKGRGFSRIMGHRNGVESVRDLIRSSAELGIEVVTLYVFSTENWSRPRREVVALMELLQETVLKETDELNANNVRLRVSGRLDELPRDARNAVKSALAETAANDGLIVNLALNYSGRTELIDAVTAIVEGGYGPEDITADLIQQHLYTSDLPDPDLLIRTSGEMRTSSFLIWQTAYTEFTFPDVLWPDFRRQHLYEAIEVYQSRQRRFGKTGDQLFAETTEQTESGRESQ